MQKIRSGFYQVALAAVLLAALVATTPARAAGRCYVNDDASGTNSGADWANAYTSLQSALADSCTEIWVAAGTYKPAASDRTVSFVLETGTAIYGGFAGTETLLTQRDPVANVTIMSGDLNGDDSGFSNNSENSYHVVYGNSIDSTAVLDGFTITGGNANGDGNLIPPQNQGGGMLNLVSSSPTLANLIFSGNSADYGGGGMTNANTSNPALTDVTLSGNLVTGNSTGNGGGGMYNASSSPTLTNVTFSANSVSATGSDGGGGLYSYHSSSTLTNVTFSGNSAGGMFSAGGGLYNTGSGSLTLMNVVFTGNSDNFTGGGMFNYASGATLTNVTFSSNTAAFGSGMYNESSSPTLTNVTFNANTATSLGGGMHNRSSNPTLTNVTFSANSADTGGGMSNVIGSGPTLTNVTFSGNSATTTGGGMYNTGSSAPTLKNVMMENNLTGGDCVNDSTSLNGASINNLIEDASNACGLTDGTNGNIVGTDPALDGLANNGGFTQTFALPAGSIAIDAGDNTACPATDQRGLSRPQNGTCDIGAVERDLTLPTVDSFGATSSSSGLTVSVSPFTASDNFELGGYKITESSTAPGAGDSGWTASAPTSYTFANSGSYSLYPWAKDRDGNVSAVYGTPASVSACFSAPVVTSSADSGAGSLRQAIADACSGGTITFNNSLSGGTIHLASTLDLTRDITIDGSSLASQIILSGDSNSDGNGDVRIMHVADDALLDVMLKNLTFTKGQSNGGSAILNQGYLTITNSNFINNSAATTGGAISNNRPLVISTSTFSSNSSTGVGYGGGAIMNNSNMTITGSTFSGNTGNATDSNGGAIYTTSPNTIIANSSFSGNSAAAGGAILTTANLTLTNSTISGNTATLSSFVSGLDIEGGTTNLSNTIIGNSANGLDCMNNATLGTNTNNLVEDGTCSPALSGDPNLGPLASNGGPTQTLALLPGSIALDAGNDTACAASPVSGLDQRGYTRPSGPHCDIGAFELLEHTISGNAGVAGATLSYTDGAPRTATADGSGNYSLGVSDNWAGTVTPSLAGYAFLPTSKDYSSTPVTTNLTGQNYSANQQAIPFLLTPADSAQLLNNLLTFDWTDASGATRYTLQVSRNTAFTQLVLNATLTPSIFTLTRDLPAATTLYWRVRKAAPVVGGWSAVRSLTTANPPGVAVLMAPANNLLTTDYTPRLDWKDVIVPLGTTFQKYQLQLSANDASFASPTSVDVSGVVTNSEYTPGADLNPNTKYYWRVRAYNTLGQYSDWSLARYFRTSMVAPTLSAPIGGVNTHTNRPAFSWGSVAGATSYTIQISRNNTFTMLVLTGTAAAASYTPLIDLPGSTLLYWRVKANGLNPGPYSSVDSFTTGNSPTTPVLTGPMNNFLTPNSTLTLKWKPVLLGTTPPTTFGHFEVQLADNAAFSAPLVDDTSVTTNLLANTLLVVSPALVPNTTYYWRVRAFETGGDYSGWSTVWTIRTHIAAPTLLSPISGATVGGLRPLFDWSDAAGATGYIIQVSKNSSFTLLVLNKAFLGGSSYTPTLNLPAGITLYWRVLAMGPNGPSAYSTTESFVTP